MLLTEYLERNARLYGMETALVEINPSDERDQATTWREFNLIENANPDAPYRREISWRDFDRRANRFANLLMSRGLKRGTKVAILMMNCLEWLPIYFGILKAGCIAVPMNFRYSSDEIKYCVELADVEVLVFGPEFISRMDPIQEELTTLKYMFFVGKNGPEYTEECLRLMTFCSSTPPPVALCETDHAAIYFSSGTTGFPKAILHNHRALAHAAEVEQNHHQQQRDDDRAHDHGDMHDAQGNPFVVGFPVLFHVNAPVPYSVEPDFLCNHYTRSPRNGQERKPP